MIDVGTGKVYSGTFTLQLANTFDLQGCAAMVFCQSETWSRLK